MACPCSGTLPSPPTGTTTVGYGHTTPLSDTGKAFSILYALIGVPFTMLVLTACIQRLIFPLVLAPVGLLQCSGMEPRPATAFDFLLLLVLMVLCFFLAPAAVFSTLEVSWSFLDGVYFSFISLCTIGLGDFVPGTEPGQKYRQLYQVSVMAFKVLNNAGDSMSFKYWAKEELPEDVAYRYVCIPHMPGFWDHVLVGTRPPPETEKMIAHDDFLPKLFNVCLGPYKFHWCCFVFRTQVILAMWCTAPMGEHAKPKVCSVVVNETKTFTTGIEFRRMVFYLAKWFTVQYGVGAHRQLKVVLDCKPSEGSLVHIVTLLASKSGMDRVIPTHQQRHQTDMNYTFNRRNAAELFTVSPAVGSVSLINIVDEFAYQNNPYFIYDHIRENTQTEKFSFM